MRTREEITQEIQDRETRIQALRQKHQTNESEIKKIREQNSTWLSENTDRERMPASLSTRRETAARLVVENQEIENAITKLELEIVGLQRETEAVFAKAVLNTYQDEKKSYLDARSQFDGLVASLLAMVQKVMGTGAELARRESPLLILENCIRLSGGNLDLQALLDGRIEQDTGRNACFIGDQVRSVMPSLRGEAIDFAPLQNMLVHLGGDPMMSATWRQRLQGHLSPVDKGVQHGRQKPVEPTVQRIVYGRDALPEKHAAVFESREPRA